MASGFGGVLGSPSAVLPVRYIDRQPIPSVALKRSGHGLSGRHVPGSGGWPPFASGVGPGRRPAALSVGMFNLRRDDFSAQVSCDHDPKFWFPLEVAQDGDKITDFSFGAFDPSLGGDLLTICYKKLAKIPHRCIVFGDFLSSGPSDPDAIETAKARFEGYARTMLVAYGRTIDASRVVRRREKFDLVIDT